MSVRASEYQSTSFVPRTNRSQTLAVPGSKAASVTAPIADLLATRWSTRAFDQDKPISHTLLRSIFEAARWAPSCFNEQPWHFIVCDKFADQTVWEMALRSLVEGNQSWAKRAPVLLVAVANRESAESGKENRWAEYDTGAASQNLCLQACSMGLAVHQMGGFLAEKLVETFEMPQQCSPVAVIALGYPGDIQNLSKSQQRAELEPRNRRPLEEFVFSSNWNQSFTANNVS